jgi:ankyrin repeat protein
MDDIYEATRTGNLKKLRNLFRIMDIDLDNTGLLCTACSYKQVEIVEFLLEMGANPDVECSGGNTSLHYIVSSHASYIDDYYDRNYEIVKLLLDYGADPNIPNILGNTPIYYVSNPRILILLLNRGADINVINNAGYTPIDFFRENGRIDLVRILNSNNPRSKSANLRVFGTN